MTMETLRPENDGELQALVRLVKAMQGALVFESPAALCQRADMPEDTLDGFVAEHEIAPGPDKIVGVYTVDLLERIADDVEVRQDVPPPDPEEDLNDYVERLKAAIIGRLLPSATSC